MGLLTYIGRYACVVIVCGMMDHFCKEIFHNNGLKISNFFANMVPNFSMTLSI